MPPAVRNRALLGHGVQQLAQPRPVPGGHVERRETRCRGRGSDDAGLVERRGTAPARAGRPGHGGSGPRAARLPRPGRCRAAAADASAGRSTAAPSVAAATVRPERLRNWRRSRLMTCRSQRASGTREFLERGTDTGVDAFALAPRHIGHRHPPAAASGRVDRCHQSVEPGPRMRDEVGARGASSGASSPSSSRVAPTSACTTPASVPLP